MNDRLSIPVLIAVLALLLFRLAVESGFSSSTLMRFDHPDAGVAEALPVEVLDAERALRALGLREVMFAGRFSPHIDMRLHQRLVEYVYPVRVVPGGAHFVLLVGDALPAPSCRIVGQHGQAQVARCE